MFANIYMDSIVIFTIQLKFQVAILTTNNSQLYIKYFSNINYFQTSVFDL